MDDDTGTTAPGGLTALRAAVAAARIPGQSDFYATTSADDHWIVAHGVDIDLGGGSQGELCSTARGERGRLDAEAVAAALNALPGILDALDAAEREAAGRSDAGPCVAAVERDVLLFEMSRIFEGAEATAAEREMVCGEGGPLAYLAGVVVPSWRVIAAAVPVKLDALRAARGEAR